jgi:hypothetical protein
MRYHKYEFEEVLIEGRGLYPVKAWVSGSVNIRYGFEEHRTPVILDFQDLGDVVVVFADTEGTCIEIDDDDKETLDALALQIYPALDQDHILDEIDEAEFG